MLRAVQPWLAVLTASLALSERAAAVTGAELIANAPQRHGRFEARLRFAPGDGIVSSFFLWKPGSELDGSYWNEIDLEKVGPDCGGYSSNAIYGDPEQHATQRIGAASDLCGAYHTHAIEWTPEHLIWLLDGVEVRRLSAELLAAFEQNALPGMQIHFNLWVGDASFGGAFSPASLPARQFIEWVSYSSYSPGAGPGGSDFTPVWREDFDGPLGSEWSYGTWASPLGHSTHSPANVTLDSGVAVLSLTADDATGFTGTAPSEPGGAAGAGTGTGTGGGAGTGTGGGAGTGTGGGGSERARARDTGCTLSHGETGSGAWLALGVLALARGLRRARSRR